MRLDIGGGNQKRGEEFVAIDLFGETDIRANMWALPFLDNSIDQIWSSHTLEHSGIYRVGQSLKEWYRVLKPGHRAIISVPNFDYIARYWLTGPDRAWAEAMVFGTQSDEGQYHKCAFTSISLKGDLEAAGFIVRKIEIVVTHNQETLRAVVVKPVKEN